MTLHEALQALADATGLTKLDTNAHGVAELVIGGGALSIYLVAVEEGQLEISIRLEELQGTDAMLDWLLDENGRRGFGRLALEPGAETVVFTHRVDLATATRASLSAAVDRVFREVATLELSARSVTRDIRHSAAGDLPAEGLLRL
jgi:hypothetical protein